MPKKTATPRKRKLPAGVTGIAEFKEGRRVDAVNAAAREFMTLPAEERTEQLKAVITIRTSWPKKPPKE